jgi:zinc/manganese transport system permease protein
MMLASILLSMLITVSGLLLSYQLDLPSGSTIIVLAGVVYVLSILLRRMITRWSKRRLTEQTG